MDGAHDSLVRLRHLSERAAVKQDLVLPGFLDGLGHEPELIEETDHLLHGFIGRDLCERLRFFGQVAAPGAACALGDGLRLVGAGEIAGEDLGQQSVAALLHGGGIRDCLIKDARAPATGGRRSHGADQAGLDELVDMRADGGGGGPGQPPELARVESGLPTQLLEDPQAADVGKGLMRLDRDVGHRLNYTTKIVNNRNTVKNGSPAVMTIKPKRSPEPDLPGRYLVTGLVGFILFAIGVPLLATELVRTNDDPRVFALSHVAVLGWITMTMFGALYQLFPVALGGTVRSPRLGRWNYWVLATGIAGFVPSFYWNWTLGVAIFGSLTVGGVLHFASQLLRSYASVQDWHPMAYYVLAALVWLVATLGFGFVYALNWHFAWFTVSDAMLAAHVH